MFYDTVLRKMFVSKAQLQKIAALWGLQFVFCTKQYSGKEISEYEMATGSMEGEEMASGT
jgi:hypothetical protein